MIQLITWTKIVVPANVTLLKTHEPRQNHLLPSLDTEKRYRFTTHALQRMFEQSLNRASQASSHAWGEHCPLSSRAALSM